MDADKLLQAIQAQTEASKALQASVESLATHVGLLVQSVAMLLGEEMGKPAPADADDGIERDWDGNKIG